MAETRVCAVCGKSEDWCRPGFDGTRLGLGSAIHSFDSCSPNDDGSCPTKADDDKGHHPFIEAHCACCGRSYAEMEDWLVTAGWASIDPLVPCRRTEAHQHSIWKDGHAEVYYFLAIEDRIKAALAPKPEPKSDDILYDYYPVGPHEYEDDESTDHDLLEALIAKVDALSALLEKRLPAWQYIAPTVTPPNPPYGPWIPWYPSTAKPFGWPEPATIGSSVTPRS